MRQLILVTAAAALAATALGPAVAQAHPHGGCPPGLAKKNNGCLPPGQAKKLVIGQPIPNGVAYYQVPQTVMTRLPPAPVGYHYVVVGSDVVLVSNTSDVITQILRGLLG